MEIDDKSKSKLYIKTKTAAMGIRGTDFQVNFNAENQNTALITFEGKVAMAHIEKGAREERFDQGKLERIVSSDKAVMVEHGQISAVNLNVAERAMTPTLLGTKQIDALKENETGVKESTEGEKKQYRNPLPPGADSAIFSNASPALVAAGPDRLPKADPNGFFNAKTGEYKLPAGSIVDLNTVNIIPPPVNAVFDPNTKTFVVPETYGKIDKTTGEYKAPDGLKLGADGKFVLVDANAYAKSQAINKEEKKEEKKEEDKKEDKKDDKKEEKASDKSDDSKKEDSKVDTNAPATVAAASSGTAPAPARDAPGPAAGTAPGPAGVIDSAGPIVVGAGPGPAMGGDPNRGPASAPEGGAPMPGPAPAMAIKIELPKIYDAHPDMSAFAERFAPVRPPMPQIITEAQRAVAAERILTTETIKQTTTTQGAISPISKVNIKFNVQ
jgi:hypothetical protein